MGLIPVGGGGPAPEPLTCFRCGDPAAGPCAMCRVMICAEDDCSAIVREPDLEEVVLCRDCARYRPFLSSSPLIAPSLAVAGIAGLVLASRVWGSASWLIGVGAFSSCCLVVFALAIAVARWQWRSRLRRARRARDERASDDEI